MWDGAECDAFTHNFDSVVDADMLTETVDTPLQQPLLL